MVLWLVSFFICGFVSVFLFAFGLSLLLHVDWVVISIWCCLWDFGVVGVSRYTVIMLKYLCVLVVILRFVVIDWIIFCLFGGFGVVVWVCVLLR